MAFAEDEEPDEPATAEESESKDEESPVPAVPRAESTQHQISLGGQVLKYTATVGWLILKDVKNKDDTKRDEPIARFGYTAYTLNGVKDPARRPVTFAFNGGPGSASIWLHMGALGPRRVVVNDGAYAPPPPAQLVDNEYSILDATDLVMIDPVGTGFSKPVGKAKGKQFWGVDQDIESVGDFIRRYITENGRWGSPKYVLGESYGGVRGAGLARHLQSDLGMNLNGLILVSPFFGHMAGDDGVGMDLPHVLYVSTFAATAWYHNALANKPASLDEYLAEVDRFAYEEYAPALLKGYAISPEEKQAIAAKLAQYTGTSAAFWDRANLRVKHEQYLQELMRDRGLIAGRIDSRFSGPSLNALNDEMDYDPFFPAVGPAYTAAFREYLHSELKFEEADEYVVSGGLYRKWDWRHKQPGARGRRRRQSPADQHAAGPRGRPDDEPGPASLGRAGPLRPRDPDGSAQVQPGPPAADAGRAQAHPRQLLRVGPHDVRASGVRAALPGECRRIHSRDGPAVVTSKVTVCDLRPQRVHQSQVCDFK